MNDINLRTDVLRLTMMEDDLVELSNNAKLYYLYCLAFMDSDGTVHNATALQRVLGVFDEDVRALEAKEYISFECNSIIVNGYKNVIA